MTIRADGCTAFNASALSVFVGHVRRRSEFARRARRGRSDRRRVSSETERRDAQENARARGANAVADAPLSQGRLYIQQNALGAASAQK